MKCLFFGILLVTSIEVFAQDTIELNNGDKIVGDIKLLDNGVLEIETDYSESNFLIDWESVVKITADEQYIISLADGQRFTGTFNVEGGKANIVSEEGESLSIEYLQVVYIKSVDSGFWDRLSLSVDGGYTVSKANDNKQLSIRGNAAYLSDIINPDVYFSLTYNTSNDGTTEIITQRDNWGVNIRVFFIKSWFALGGADFLRSNEQALDLRSTYSLGLGNFLIRNHKMYLSSALGIAYNDEAYDPEKVIDTDPNVSSTEAFIHMNYNAFGLKDMSITSGVKVFPSLSNSGRVRVNYDLDIKFDLPKDFYIGAGYTLTYDSEPITADVANSDYVITTSIGWSL